MHKNNFGLHSAYLRLWGARNVITTVAICFMICVTVADIASLRDQLEMLTLATVAYA